ncbi:hypothetical protein IQ230_06825 [Gloeocapsopsis crepidinum LEGE 06123]|uniref:Uncharacterized protein n=1 Tax=Gloeocapsopsis crepidinum LEGE 06123 TaxID=588587 RepID=A0ABR9UPW5_9CHRO|nr:DUF6658 family protein [Gloeocapsopsis crepidinum]MBE9190078.1 hypothetical protein [Gloeocapsopsis crepidinum LEGE 06123]
MNRLVETIKKLKLRQILTVLLAGILVVFSTACSPGDVRGANPDNPAVQAGGANNPYKGGGDAYTDYNLSPDTKVNNKTAKSGRNQASVQFNEQLVATNDSEILYPGAETPEGRLSKESQLPVKTAEDFKQPASGGLIQRDPDLGKRVEKRLEKVQEAFGEASEFVGDKANEASRRPEATSNPALRSK